MRARKNLIICLVCVCLTAGVGCKKGADNPPEQAGPARQTISMEQPAPPPPAKQPTAPEVMVVEKEAPGPMVVTGTPRVPAETAPPASGPVTETEPVAKEAAEGPSAEEQQAPSDMPATPAEEPPATPAEEPPAPPVEAVSDSPALTDTADPEETDIALPASEVETGAGTVDGTAMETTDEMEEAPADDVASEIKIVIDLMEEENLDAEETAKTAAENQALAMFSPFTPLFQKDANEDDMFLEQDSQRKRAFLTPLERISLGQLQLSGIIRAASGNRAIVTDATGKGYVVKKGTYIGLNSGQVEEIVDDRVIVVEMVGGRRAVTELKLQKPAGE